MDISQISTDRTAKLADIAEWYYLDGLNQSEIAKKLGVDRSMVSRMLAEARKQNIVEIRIRRPLSTNHELEEKLGQQFNLHKACVLVNNASPMLVAIMSHDPSIPKLGTISPILGIFKGVTDSNYVNQSSLAV